MTDTSRLRSLLAFGVSAVALAAAAPVLAQATGPVQPSNQSAATVTPPGPSTGGAIPEVIVTAEKRQTNLQKVPVAVSVFTAQERDNIGINSVQDVTNYAPGFTYDPGDVHAYIRGVGRQSIIVSDEARVAAYEDGFYVYSPYNLAHSTLFLKQEQIERGPQNVGGKNANAGSIDMISVRPTDTPYAEVRGTFEDYAHTQIEGAASNALLPWLDGRIAGYTLQQNTGFYKNVVPGEPSEGNDLHEYYLEGQLQAHFGDKAEFWMRTFLSGWHNRGDAGARNTYVTGSWDETNLTDGNGYPGAGLFVNPNYGYTALSSAAATAAGKAGQFPAVAATLANPTVFDNPSLTNIRHFAALEPRDTRLKNYDDLNYIFTYHLTGMDFKYVGGVQGYNYTLNYSEPDTNVTSFTLPGSTIPCGALVSSFAGTPLAGLNCPTAFAAAHAGTLPPASQLVINPLVNLNYKENDWWTSHEFSLESTDSGPLQWIAGGMYFYQEYQNPIAATAPQQPQLTHPLAALPLGFGGSGPLAGTLAAPNPNNYLFFQSYDMSVTSYDGYGQVSYKFSDSLKLTGNLRWTHDEKKGTEFNRDVAFNASIINGLQGFFGAATPSLDATTGLICPTGNAANCTTGALAKGVASAATMITSGPQTGTWQRALDGTTSDFSGGLGLEYTPNRDTFMYARYSRGYQGLTFNAGFISSNPEVAPETINSYEIGYKQNIGRTISFDADIFYYDYDNLQVPLSINNGGVVQSQFLNVPKSESEGFEFEGNWAPIKNLLFTMSYSYDKSQFNTGCAINGGVVTGLCVEDTNDPAGIQPGAKPVAVVGGVAVQSIKGDPLPQSPKNKFAFNAAYTLPFEPGSLTLSASYVWRDVQNGTVFNRSYDNAPSWDQVDLRGLWRAAGGRYEIIGYVRNVFNSVGYEAAGGGAGLLGNATSTGLFEQNVYTLTPPRTYGVELRYKFF